MYSYNNGMYKTNTNSYPKANNNFAYQSPNNNDDRFIGPFLGPLLLGGIAGYALRPPYPAPYPVAVYPGPIYYPYNNPNTTYTQNSYYY